MFLTYEVTVEIVDDVGIVALFHDDDLVDDEFLLGLLLQIHLFNSHLASSGHLDADEHSTGRTTHRERGVGVGVGVQVTRQSSESESGKVSVSKEPQASANADAAQPDANAAAAYSHTDAA